MDEITELWEAELLDSLILINVVVGISVMVRSLGLLGGKFPEN